MKNGEIRERALMVIFIMLIISVFVVAGLSRSYLVEYSDILKKNLSDKLISTAKNAVNEIPVVELDAFMKNRNQDSAMYKHAKNELINFAHQSDVLYVYYMKIEDGQLMYVIDNDVDPTTMVTPGMETTPDGFVMEAFDGRPVSTHMGTYSESWDGLMSAYAPVFVNNKVAYVVGVDIEDTMLVNVLSQNNRIGIIFLSLLVATSIIGLIFIIQMRKRANEYKRASLAKSDFLSRMSHEIRTPMNAIIGLSRMSAASDDIDQVHEYVENIRGSSGYLLSLLNNILDISKIEAGRMRIDEETVKLRGIVQNTRRMIEPQAEKKEIELCYSIDELIPETLSLDDTHLTQILMNLLGNAVKFTPEGGRISLSINLLDISDEKIHLSFEVEDNGVGIKPESISKLFDPFEQEDGSTTRKYGGTGLGLSIAKLLVELMGGSIGVTSVMGEGSKFFFDIYAHVASEWMNIDAEAEEEAAVDLGGKTLLVVEDNEINRVIAENVLEGFGARVEFAENGLEGVEKFTGSPGRYAAIFMDIQMPVMDGYEATREIRKSGAPGAADIPIIAMTANVFAEDIERAKNAGMDDHVGKPLDLGQVEEAIRRNIL